MKKTVNKDGYVFVGQKYANTVVEIKLLPKFDVKNDSEYFDIVAKHLTEIKDLKIDAIYDGAMSFIIELNKRQFYLRPNYSIFKSIPSVEVSRGLSAFAILKTAYPKLEKAIIVTNAKVDYKLIGINDNVKNYVKIFSVNSENDLSEAILSVCATQA